MTDVKRGVKITVASISALVLAVVCIVAAPLPKDVLNDIVNPAYRETVIFPDNGRANPKDTTICIGGIEIRMIGVRGGKNHCEGVRPRGCRGTQSLPRTQVQTAWEIW